MSFLALGIGRWWGSKKMYCNLEEVVNSCPKEARNGKNPPGL